MLNNNRERAPWKKTSLPCGGRGVCQCGVWNQWWTRLLAARHPWEVIIIFFIIKDGHCQTYFTQSQWWRVLTTFLVSYPSFLLIIKSEAPIPVAPAALDTQIDLQSQVQFLLSYPLVIKSEAPIPVAPVALDTQGDVHMVQRQVPVILRCI